jgi:hypothetical protein
MSPLAEEYRRKAQLAEATPDQWVKEIYLEVAERCRRFAERAETNNTSAPRLPQVVQG